MSVETFVYLVPGIILGFVADYLFYYLFSKFFSKYNHEGRNNNKHREVEKMSKKLYLVEQGHQGVNKNFLVMVKNIGEAEKIVNDYLEGKIKSDKSSEIW